MDKENDKDSDYVGLLDKISFQPIFIMGLHRSGTSILYKMLGETGHFNIVTAYHILKYDELLSNYKHNLEKQVKNELGALFESRGIKSRRIDHLPITPDFAQEYVYLFSKKKTPDTLSERNLILFKNLCKKIQHISNNKYPILLKNPYDFPNFLYIKKQFANAKFIFIHRNPLEVLSSTIRAWQILYKEKNPYTSLFSEGYKKSYDNPFIQRILRFYYSSKYPLALYSIIRYSTKATNMYLQNINQLQKEEFISITYENLCQKPNSVMGTILDFLNMKSDIDFDAYIKPRKLAILPEVQRMKKRIGKKMNAYNEYFGYEKLFQ